MPNHSSPFSSAHRNASLHSSTQIADPQHIDSSSGLHSRVASSRSQSSAAKTDDFNSWSESGNTSASGENGFTAAPEEPSQHRFWATVPPCAANPTPGSDPASMHASLEEVSDGQSQLVVHNRISTQVPGSDTGTSEPMRDDWNAMLVPAPHLLLHQPGGRSQVGIPGIMGRDHQSRILFVSLLESYCRTYDDDPLRNRRLFFAICRTLYSMGIIGKEYVDEMSSIRATYSDAFRQLVAKAQASLDMYKQHDIETGIRSLMAGVADESSESLGPDQLDSSDGGWSASDQDAEPDQTDDVFEKVRMQRRESVGVADRCVAGHQPSAAAAAGVPIMPQRAKSRRNTVSNFGNSSTSHAPRSLSYKHSYPRTYRQHSAHQGGSLQAYGPNASVSANSSAPTTFESMIIDMQRSRYHDDFIQLQCLGKGGFGKVYEVRNKLDARRYAVKQIKIKGEITAEKTLREIKTLAHLDHPNIVRYYSSWIEVTKLRKRTSYNSKDSGNGILGIVASPPPLPQSSAISQQSQHQGFRHRHATTIAADHMTDDNSSFSLSSDDEVSFCLAEQQQHDGCFEMSLTGDGEEQKTQPVEDSALESLDETSGYSLWRTANYQDIAIDDENVGFDTGERDPGFQDGSGDISSGSSGSSCQISFVDFGGNDTDNDVVFVAGGDFSDSHDDDDDDDDDGEMAPDDGNKDEAGDMKLEDKTGSVSCPSTTVCGTNPCPGEQNDDDEQKCATTNGNRGHARRKSVHVVGGTYIDDEYGARNYVRKISRSPQGLYDDGSFASAGQQARSLPSQGMAIPGMSDSGQTLVAETSLFVQMQLCQTTLQEFLMQRNERIASRQASANASASLEKRPADGDYRASASIPDSAADWCAAKREHDLLIDPVMNIRLFRAIVEGVKYFHNRGVIHRDLKGANVFLDIVYSDSGGNPISRGGSGIGRPDASAARAYQQSQQPGLSSVHPLSRVMHAGGSGGLVSVHSDVWDAVDGGNLKEKIGVAATSEYDERNSTTSAPVSMVPGDPLLDSTDGAGAGDVVAMETRKVDWDSIFESILAHRSIDGTAHGNGFGDKARCASDSSDSDTDGNEGDKGEAGGGNRPLSVRKKPSTAYMSPMLPPAVSFIPRIGDFGLATKATLGIRTSGDEYAFIGNSRGASTRQSSSGSSSSNSSASSTPSESNKISQSKKQQQQQQQQQQAATAAGGADCWWDTRRTSNVGTITYAAPEQLSDKATDYSEKADIYSLGIIFFELYYPFATAMERIAVIRDLRRGVFPPQFLQMWPKEAALILQLMDADPTKRPSAKEILAFDLIDVPTLESAQLKREVTMLRQQLRVANQRNEELGLRVRELERIVDMSI